MALGLLLCQVGLHVASAQANMIQNPSCEETAEDGRPAGWTYTYSSGGGCDVVVDTQVKRTGRGSIRLSTLKGGASYPRIVQPVELAADTSYRLTAWVRSTTGRTKLQVTPDGGTWFGADKYGAAVGIPAGEQWRSITKQIVTYDAAKVNIVFTLQTPNREATDLWVDDVSLVRAGPRPDRWRYIPPPSKSVALPQVGWARDLPGPRRRVLLVAPLITIRDVIELAQRMDVDAEVRYASAEAPPLTVLPQVAPARRRNGCERSRRPSTRISYRVNGGEV